jgi:hypothetical protein
VANSGKRGWREVKRHFESDRPRIAKVDIARPEREIGGAFGAEQETGGGSESRDALSAGLHAPKCQYRYVVRRLTAGQGREIRMNTMWLASHVS